MSFEDVAHEGKCDCCGKERLVVCCASRLGPVSLCYCKTCHANGIEPYDMLVTSIAMAGDYPYFIPHLFIPSEAIHSLSLLFACGDTLGEVRSCSLPSP